MLTRPADIEGAVAAAERVVEIHRRLAEWLCAGVSLAKIDAFVAENLRKLESKSAFLHYRTGRYPPFPSHACLSPNDVVVHGTAGMSTDAMEPGDIISIDIGVKHRGWVGDAAWTFAIETVSDEARRLCDCGKESIRLGIRQLQPGAPLINWAATVEDYVEGECGYFLIRGLGGHGYGKDLHAPPFISNVRPRNRIEWPDANYVLQRGDLIAVEPPELIGGDISVSKAEPEVIERSVQMLGQNRVLVGAGVKNSDDIRIALSLGASGVLLASGVTKAPDPYAVLMDLVSGLKL